MSTSPTTGLRVLTLPALLDEQAAQTPQEAALVFQGSWLTYREVQVRMNRVANYLHARGVSRGARVGLLVQRGEAVMENIPLLFGIMKAGAVYVPLDRSLPPHRLSFILRDAEISLLITQRSPGPRLSPVLSQHSLPVLCMDESREEVDLAGEEPPPAGALPAEGESAYILYTSGSSTGNPKGVIVGHRSLAHFAIVQNAALGIGRIDRATQFFSLAFDASLSDLTMLAAGATLYPLPPEALLGGNALLAFLQEHAITVATLVPSVALTLPAWNLPALRILIVGGEVCPASLGQKAWQPSRRIFNAYGLTETTVCISLGECDPTDGSPPSIGRPFPGIEVSIRDEHLFPVPTGTVGQICVGGECLALGYTDEAMTARRFVSDPLAPSGRLFLTHDLGALDAAGTISFVERLDKTRRLKLPGAKQVDLDEIESLLWQYPGMRECAVEHFDGRIVAYVSLTREALGILADDADQEREGKERGARQSLDGYLRQRLFGYMCPRAFGLLPSLPRTSSDKIDRNALRDEVTVIWSTGVDTVQARTPQEQMLAEIVAEMMTSLVQRMALLKSQIGDGSEHASSDLPVVTWQQVDMSSSASEQGDMSLDSLDAPDFALRVLQRCGVNLDNREFFVPLGLVASAVEFQQYQRADLHATGGGEQ